jgi:PAS domain S-box-containing protein
MANSYNSLREENEALKSKIKLLESQVRSRDLQPSPKTDSSDSQRFLQTILSEAPLIIFSIDNKGVFTFSDGKGLKKLGLQPGEVVGLSVFKVYKDFPEIKRQAKEALNGVKVREIATVGDVQYDTFYKPVFDNENKLISVVGVAVDISDLKNTELELREAMEFNQLIFENTSFGILTFNSKGACQSVNKEAATIIGSDMSDLLKINYNNLKSWSKNGMLKAAQRTLQSKKQVHERIFEESAFAKETWIDCYFSYFESKGEPHLLLLIKDITQSIEVEQERDRYFETATALLCTANFEGYFLTLNPAWEVTLGHSKADLMSKPFLDFVHPDDINSTLDTLQGISQGEEAINFINRYRCKDGSYKWISWMSRSFGKKIYASAQDITNLKEQETTILNTMKELERSNKELEQFAYISSHDLQEPLRKVKSYTELLANKYENRLDEDARFYMNTIIRGATRMQRLIEDLLSYSRVSTQAKPFKNVDFREVLKTVQDTLELLIFRNNAKISLCDLPSIMADESQIVLLFQNLISNAIKFKSDKDPKIEITCKENKETWQFCVKDNGIGISAKHQSKIFTIFQRLHSKDKYEGTGIGLAIVSKIVARHKGEIWVESKENKGSKFYFTIYKFLT